jgi:hypothetical protein
MFVTNAKAEIAVVKAKTDWASISRSIERGNDENTRKEVRAFEHEMQRFANLLGSVLTLNGK